MLHLGRSDRARKKILALGLGLSALSLACSEPKAPEESEDDGNLCLRSDCSETGTGGTGGDTLSGSGGNQQAAGGTGGGGSDPFDCTRHIDASAYGHDEVIAPSQMPPGGLPVSQTPLFVAIGFDDNPASDGMAWATEMLSSKGVKATFFHTTNYAPDALDQWSAAVSAGHETALHTQSHNTGTGSSQETWQDEISSCFSLLSTSRESGGLGVPASQLYGSRAPYLEFNDAMLSVLDGEKLWYDSSIQEGYDSAQDGTNLYYPYTLGSGSPGHTYNKSFGFELSQFDLTPHAGLIELPVYALIVPPDSEAAALGFSPGLRSRISVPDFVETGYKITGFDYNLWAQAFVSGAEFTAILKHNLNLRRAGNRAPFLFGAHTADYADSQEHRQALEDFLTYAASFPEVRIVTYKQVLDFMREPKALSCY